jgi:iron(III) transport system permease protein
MMEDMKRLLVCGSALLALAVLALLPVVVAVVRAVTYGDGEGAAYLIRSFGEFFAEESLQRELMLNTFALGLVSAALALALGLPYAFLTSRTDLPGRRLFSSLYILPIIVPPLIAAIAWAQLTLWWYEASGRSPREEFLFSGLGGSSFVFAMSYVPLVILFARRAFERIPASYEEAGIVAAGRWRTIRRILVPLTRPAVLAAAAFVFIFTTVDFAVVDYLNTFDSNFGERAYTEFAVYPIMAFSKWQFGDRMNTSEATAETLPLAVLAIAMLWVAFRLRSRAEEGLVGTTFRTPPPIRLRAWKAPAVAFCVLLLGLSFATPVGVLLVMSGSLDTYTRLFSPLGILTELRTTVLNGLLAASFATMIAFVLAWMAVRAGRRLGRLLEMLVFLPLAIPPILFGFGLLLAWNWSDLVMLGIRSGATKLVVPVVLFTLVAKYMAFPFMTISTQLRSLEPSQDEAARSAGVPWSRRVWGVLVPLTRPGILAGWVLALVFCMREIDTLALLTGSDSTMFAIYSLIHTAREEMVAAICVLQVVMLGLPLLLWAVFGWLRRRLRPT